MILREMAKGPIRPEMAIPKRAYAKQAQDKLKQNKKLIYALKLSN